MPLTPGSRLGPYEVLSALGSGGMGEVYRARDTQLGRDVAVKIMVGALASDPEHLGRFEREARMLAALNHPGIAQIYGLEERDGMRFVVLEFVEGDPLDRRLASGPVPAPEALDLASQIADALSAAHERGVVHRDLKPANVMVTPDGRAKVLDFGLAKPLTASTPAVSQQLTAPPAMTAAGTILGTPAYMSPEQARGRAVDERSDLWSFGCVVYEMLTADHAFSGETIADCLASILQEEPDWTRLPKATPASIRRLLRRCLAKDPAERPGSAKQVRLEIEDARGRMRSPRRGRARVGPAPMRRLIQLTLARGLEESPAFSPAGDEIAYAADVGGVRKIFVRSASGGGETAVTSGALDDIQPCWSPDGRTIAFVRARSNRRLEPDVLFGAFWEGDIWTVDRATGLETRLVEDAYNPAYSPDASRIAFDAPWAGQRRIWSVDPQGHNPKQLTSDVSEAIAHARPRWSPDGRRIVFQNRESTKFDVRMIDLAAQTLHWVTHDFFQDLQPVWSPAGRYIYFSSYRSGGLNLWRIAVTATGKPRGAPEQMTTGAGQDLEPAVSSEGGRLAFSIRRQNADLWLLPVDPSSGRPTGPPRERIATNRENSRGAWSPDGRSIAFNSDRAGDMNIWIQDAHGEPARQLTSGPGGDFQANWSPDGRTIAFFSSRAGTPDIWTADVFTGALEALTRTPALDVNPSYSPDGRSIAFQSDRNGRLEIWVMRADGSEARALTRTRVMGHFLRWTKDAQSIIFRSSERPSRTMRAPISGDEPEVLADVAGGAHMSFSPDFSLVMDAVGHRELWVSPLDGRAPEKVFEFDDPDARIDYPVWSPDGKWVLFDRFRPQGGDIWMMEGVE